MQQATKATLSGIRLHQHKRRSMMKSLSELHQMQDKCNPARKGAIHKAANFLTSIHKF